MIYKRGQRYILKRTAVQQLLAGHSTIAHEHDSLLDQGYGWPRITVNVAMSGLATVRATWRMRAGDCRHTHRLIIRGVRLA
ncbi:hypothetical protein [Ferrovibrio sp.]|uniref:hypothetical protein n=1 Tax=Ferrovibrio sp. TaxID=1917215 RepID=UPI0035B09BC7